MNEEEERELAASVFDMVSSSADTLAALLPEPAGSAVRVGVTVAGIVAKLIRTLGAGNALERLEALHARVTSGEGTITDEDVRGDDDAVMSDIASWYADDDGEHPPDDPETEVE